MNEPTEPTDEQIEAYLRRRARSATLAYLREKFPQVPSLKYRAVLIDESWAREDLLRLIGVLYGYMNPDAWPDLNQ
jgi:hypothetical protein